MLIKLLTKQGFAHAYSDGHNAGMVLRACMSSKFKSYLYCDQLIDLANQLMKLSEWLNKVQ